MSDIIVPPLGESVAEATIAKWYKNVGDAVNKDDTIVELETDKVTLEINALASGALKEIKANEGDSVEEGNIIGVIEDGATGNVSEAPKEITKEVSKEAPKNEETTPVSATAPSSTPIASDANGPAVRKIAAEKNINTSTISGSGKDGRVTKGDVIASLEGGAELPITGSREKRVKMTNLRKAIAKRLKESQNTAAMLTTFNEIDMTNVIALRSEYKDLFADTHNAKLGFMSFFTKAVVSALKEYPAVNAEIKGDELIYKNYYDIGMAVGTPKGLVVPVLRNCDQLSFAGIENELVSLAKKARHGDLTPQDLTGGTFTITNGGVYGSMLSTPIINPPQSGILGLHNIVKRPVVMPDGSIQARPVMYVALSYDHRIVDGREAVTFLVKIKEKIEDPRRLLLGL